MSNTNRTATITLTTAGDCDEITVTGCDAAIVAEALAGAPSRVRAMSNVRRAHWLARELGEITGLATHAKHTF